MKKILLLTFISAISFNINANTKNSLPENCKNQKCDISVYEDFNDFKKENKKNKAKKQKEEINLPCKKNNCIKNKL